MSCPAFIRLVSAALSLCSAAALFALAEQPCNAERIPEDDIVALENLLKEGAGDDSRSGVAKRRAFKNVARSGLALVEQYPDAPNRFRILGLVVEGQKRILALEGNDKSRQALFDACEMLREAPEPYAKERLEADLLLSDRDLSARDATRAERAEALSALLDRYHGTAAEARSLLMGALIVQQLDAQELESRILDTLDDKFADDHEVIEFRRKFLRTGRLDLVFSGEYERIDGTKLVFPDDTRGHMILIVFWSKNSPGIDKYLEATQSDLTKANAHVDVFSFNVDGLPDGGQSVLQRHGLDWTVMKLPEGRLSQAYQSYAQRDPAVLLVNEYGLAVVKSDLGHQRSTALDEARISDARYTMLLQSLFNGDFLMSPERQSCIGIPPFRYRLSREEALANYRRGETLCGELIGEGSPESVWRIRDDRIIALLGLWNLAFEPKHLAAAVREARITLAADLPVEAQVVSRFCLARQELRSGNGEPESVVAEFLEACGGEAAPAAAVAAAAVLALDARSRDRYAQYRDRFLASHAGDPHFYAFTAFLRDRHLQYRLLSANHTRRERGSRGYIVGLGYPWPTNSLPSVEFKNLDGTGFKMPDETNGKLTYLLFVEPPAGGGTNNWPVARDSRGRSIMSGTSGVHLIMDYAGHQTKANINQDIRFITAFLTDDADHVRYLMQTNGWNCQAVMVPGGLRNPMVRQLGIFSADRYANVFLLRRDGTIAWHGSGFRYRNEFGFPFAYTLAMQVHVEACDVEYGLNCLERGRFKEAVRVFTGPFAEDHPNRYSWRSSRYHGKALAQMGLNEWEAALESIECAIDAHKLRHFGGHGRRSRNEADWRKDAARVEINNPCDTFPILWGVKADILESMGRADEADIVRARAEQQPAHQDRPDVYKDVQQKLEQWRLTTKKERDRT